MQWRCLIPWNPIPHSLLVNLSLYFLKLLRCWRCDPKRVACYQVLGELQLSHLCLRAKRPAMGSDFHLVQVLQIVGRSERITCWFGPMKASEGRSSWWSPWRMKFHFFHILLMHSVSQWPGDAASAERWLREAEQRGLSPRVTTYTAVVDACATWFDGLIPRVTSGAPTKMKTM